MWHSKRKEQEVSEKDILKEVFFKKLNYIKTKRYNDKVFEKLSWIFKVFIMNYFHIKYEYTNKELKTQLQRKRVKPDIKERIIALSDKITDIKYNKESSNKKEFLELVKEMKDIVKELKKREKM